MSKDSSQSRQNAKGQLKKILPGLLRDIALPAGAYYILKYFGASDVTALIAGGLVSGVLVVIELIIRRTLDFIALFMMILFVVGIATLFLTGDARFMLAKDSIGTGVAGLFFIGSAIIGKPIITEFAKKTMSGEHQKQFANGLQNNSTLRKAFRNATMISGFILIAEAILRLPLIYTLSISVMVALSPILGIMVTVLTVIVSIKYVKWVVGKSKSKISTL